MAIGLLRTKAVAGLVRNISYNYTKSSGFRLPCLFHANASALMLAPISKGNQMNSKLAMSSDAAVGIKSGLPLMEKTFQYDETLPSLPVPPLEGTLTKYLESVKPFVSEDEFRETESIVQDFGQGIGQTLHQKLVEKSNREKNWLEKWWEDYAYLISRVPLGVLSNMVGPFFAIGDVCPPRQGTQIERTAIFLWVALKYFQLVRKEKLPVMKNSSGDTVFAMNQLRSLFCTSRVPGENMDEIKRYFKTEREGSCPQHIIVLCNGHMFKVDGLFDEDGEVIGALAIQRQLAFIKDRSVTKGQGISILTADDRSSYAKIYHHLCSLDPANAEHLETINSAVMVLTLDPENPTNITELFWQGMSGPNGHDRWFDKSYNCIAFQNGTLSSTGDHAPLDGVVVAMYSYWCHQQLRALEHRIPGSNIVDSSSNPEEIVFVTDQKVEDAKIHAAETYSSNANKIDIVCSQFGAFGKKFVKSKGFHPDAFLQLGIQLTYYSLYNKCVPCYETATTRQYYHGRTETVRSTTLESVEWCKAMQDPSKSKSERHALLKRAHAKHMQLMIEAMSGKGIDRHLMGLYVMALETGEPIPAIFTDPSYNKSGGGGNFILSTSLVGYIPVQGAVPAMCLDGYGCFYAILNDFYQVTVTCYKNCPKTDAMLFFETLSNSLMRMKGLTDHAKL